MPGTKEIKWNTATMETIMVAHAKLIELGMSKPSIRAVLYYLTQVPPWEKRHYGNLTHQLGKWRDGGLIPFGLFADDGAGANWTPLTTSEIARRIKALEGVIPARLAADGYLYAVHVEHISLVDMIAEWLDYQVPVVSSQGQLRREHLHSVVTNWLRVAEELGAKGIKCFGLTDYDKGGSEIFNTHKKWFKKIFDLDFEHWGIKPEQVRAAGLDTTDKHQIDGWIARYGPRRVRAELRALVHLPEKEDTD